MTNSILEAVTNEDSILLKASEDSFLLKAKVLNHMQKVLAKKKSVSLGVLFQRVGVGLTSKHFEGLVRILVDCHFCTVTVGERGAVTINLNENSSNRPEASEVA